MIQPVNNTRIHNQSFTSTYDKETRSLLNKAVSIFDNTNISVENLDVFISQECGDIDLIKQMDNKEVSLSKFRDGNILLQVADKDAEVVEILYHNVQDSRADRFYKYKDVGIYPWNKGRDIKVTSDYVTALKLEQKDIVQNLCKKYIPKFLESFNKIVPNQLLKTRL